jgi:D-alanyl-D-alanine carboxypeptidase/D-alanyl-D-alanine-endopeptidase (penicillin-binding protein 4)
MLERRGVTVAHPARRGVRPSTAPVLTSISSAPLGDVVGEMLTTSDDNTAELLVKEIGFTKAGVGTRAAGTKVVHDTLATWGVPTDGVVLTDGSGLDQSNRLTCDTLVGVLGHAGPQGPLYDGLPVAGVTGTLGDQFIGSPVQGKLRAKTGTLTGVKSLSGFYPASDGRMLRFALVINGALADDKAAWPLLWTQLGDVYGAFPDGPEPAELAPPTS